MSKQTSSMPAMDVVMDTDAYTEIDDLYAIAYLLKHSERLNVKGFCAAPFNKPARAATPRLAMEKSYEEIRFLLKMMNREFIPVYYGSPTYLADENTPVESPAADFMAKLADFYSPDHPLYILAIGSIPNVASAILKNPRMIENCVVVWLGGHAVHMPNGADEYNMRQDIAGARIVFGCGIRVVHLPCNGVIDRFLTTRPELACWLKGKNELCDYLYTRTVEEAENYAAGKPWSRVIWDVTTVAWLLNDHERFMKSRLMPAPIPCYDLQYKLDPARHPIHSVYHIERDALLKICSKHWPKNRLNRKNARREKLTDLSNFHALRFLSELFQTKSLISENRRFCQADCRCCGTCRSKTQDPVW